MENNTEWHLVIAEDDTDLRNILREVLSSITMNILLAQDGNQALHYVSNYPVAALVIDVNMARLSGATLLQKLRNSGNKIPAVLISGSHKAASFANDQKMQPCSFVKKPFNNQELREIVKKAYSQGLEQVSSSNRQVH